MNQPTLEELDQRCDEILSKAKKSDELDPDEISEDAEAEDEAEDETDDSADDAEDEEEEEADDDEDDVKKSSLIEDLDDDPADETMRAVATIIAKSMMDVLESVTDSREYTENSNAILAKSLLAQNVILNEQTASLHKANSKLAKMNKSLAEKLDALEAKLDTLGAHPAHMRKSVASYTDRNFAESAGGTGAGRPTLTKPQISNILTNELLNDSDVVTPQDVLNNESGAPMRPEIRALIDNNRARWEVQYMEQKVFMNDYLNFGQGFGRGSAADVEYLTQMLAIGNHEQANGAALQVESLEGSLKVLTHTHQHFPFWKRIAKHMEYTTDDDRKRVSIHGAPTDRITCDAQLLQRQDSEHRRQATLVKFIGTTREVTHLMTLVRSAYGDVIARQNQEGILWLLKQVEHALFWGDSKLAAEGKEGVQFDGLESMIPDDNTIDLKGNDLRDVEVNMAAEMIVENYGSPTDLFVPVEVMSKFSQEYLPKERVIMPTGNGYQAGVVVSQFQTIGGSINFEPDLFLRETKPLSSARYGGTQAPTAVKAVAVELADETDAEFAKSGAGTYSYSVTACNEFGESIPVEAPLDIVLTADDLSKGVLVKIQNSTSMVVAPEWFNVYRTEKDGKQKYLIARVPAASTVPGESTRFVDKNSTMPNTYTAFMGQLTPDVITFKQLAPLMKMDLAQLAPVYRWMILLYGVPILYMPRRWVRLKNIKKDKTVL